MPADAGTGAGGAERRVTIEQAAARALLNATSIDQATPQILAAICEALGWAYGALWVVRQPEDDLVCADVWSANRQGDSDFERISRARTFTRGVGLPGRVWA